MPIRVLGRMMKHVGLVSRMARATETDLVGAVERGTLDHETWADMVDSCRRCGWAAECPAWLDRNDRVECAPETCPNRDRFESLKKAAADHDRETV